MKDQWEIDEENWQRNMDALDTELERVFNTKDWENLLEDSIEEAMNDRYGWMGAVERFKNKMVDIRMKSQL